MTTGSPIDIAGQVFGRLTAIRYSGKSTSSGRLWLCRCECGTERTMPTSTLRSGVVVSCGCFNLEKAKLPRTNLSGKVFGKLTAIEVVGKIRTDRLWRCVCKCGVEKIVNQSTLNAGRVISCGCARLDSKVYMLADVRNRLRAHCHTRRARQLKVGGSFTAAQITAMYAAQGGFCKCCRKELNGEFHRDHIKPLSRGGSNDISNIQLLCAQCNYVKNDRWLEPVHA